MPKTTRPAPKTPATYGAIRKTTIPYPAAFRQLSISRSTLDEMCDRDVFTRLQPGGKGTGKRVYLYADEVDLFDSTRSEDAVRDLRARKRRLTKTA